MIDRLANPEALALLALIPIALWSFARRRRTRASLALPAPPGRSLPRTLRARLLWLLPLLRIASLIALTLALARPQSISGQTKTRTEGVAIQIVVDRSGSMDEPMDDHGREARKMDVVTRVLEQFIVGGEGLEPREGDMLGLIAFARYADTICPLVRGRDAVAGLVSTLDTVKQRSEDGTAIGDALALAAARLRRAEEELAARRDDSLLASPAAIPNPANPAADTADTTAAATDSAFTIKSKVILLVTDGVNNAGVEDPLEVARLAAEWGIKVYVIGVGAGQRYVTMQTFAGEQRVPVGPSLDEPALREIARATGGQYFPASDAQTLTDIYEQIGQLERSEIHVLEYDDVQELFTPLAIAAAACLALELLLAATWLRRGP